MSDYNLNDPQAFAALTSAFGVAGGNPTQSQWNVVQSSYKGVPFHILTSAQATKQGSTPNYSAAVDRVQDHTGRRKVMYQFPFQNGQTTGDLGRKPFVFHFNVLFFGSNYFAGYQKFYNVLNTETPGSLVHPILGSINCVATDWEVVHQSTERLALAMRVEFQEHTYTPGLAFTTAPGGTPNTPSKPSTFKGALIAAMSVFQTINAVTTAITNEVRYAKSLINGSIALVNGVKSEFLGVLQSLYLSFSPTAVSLAPDLPGLLPVNLGGQANAAGGSKSALYPLTSATQTPFSQQGTPSATNTGINSNLTPLQAQQAVNGVLAQIETVVQLLNSATPQGGTAGQGALDFYDEVFALKQLGVQLVQACLLGIASSQQVTTTFVVPDYLPAMSIYEVAFAIGLSMNNSDQIRQLNPELLSVNFIPGGTVLNIPVVG